MVNNLPAEIPAESTTPYRETHWVSLTAGWFIPWRGAAELGKAVIKRSTGVEEMAKDTAGAINCTLYGRDNGRTQGDNPWVLLVTSSLARALCLPSHAVLRCPTAAAFPRQAAGTHLASPPCSHPALATHALMSAHPHTLFLQTHKHGLISHSFWTTSPTAAQALE